MVDWRRYRGYVKVTRSSMEKELGSGEADLGRLKGRKVAEKLAEVEEVLRKWG